MCVNRGGASSHGYGQWHLDSLDLMKDLFVGFFLFFCFFCFSRCVDPKNKHYHHIDGRMVGKIDLK